MPPSTVSSPSAGLINHLSNTFPSQAHKAYHLDHRLFVDTSSLLPPTASGNQDAASATPNSGTRQYTHLLTTSHSPQSTFVGTTAKNDTNNLVMITIPTEGQDGFMQLLVMRMQALWAHRQSVALEGVSVDLPLRKSEQWTVRVGDLKSTGTGLTRAAGGPGAGGARAVLVEIQYSQNIAAEDQTTDEPTLEVYEDILRGLLKKLFKDVNDFNFEDAKGLVRKTDGNRSPDDNGKPHGWRLASLYMDVLRGTRG